MDSWRAALSANLDSVFNVTGRVVDRMLSQRIKGVVVSIGSIAAQGNAGQSAYSAAKAGVRPDALLGQGVRAARLPFRRSLPGFIDTSTRAALSEAVIDHLQPEDPLRRLGEPEGRLPRRAPADRERLHERCHPRRGWRTDV